jgi:hypothetical protein
VLSDVSTAQSGNLSRAACTACGCVRPCANCMRPRANPKLKGICGQTPIMAQWAHHSAHLPHSANCMRPRAHPKLKGICGQTPIMAQWAHHSAHLPHKVGAAINEHLDVFLERVLARHAIAKNVLNLGSARGKTPAGCRFSPLAQRAPPIGSAPSYADARPSKGAADGGHGRRRAAMRAVWHTPPGWTR